MTTHQLRAIADSAGLKMAQYAITGLMVPAALWFGGRMLDDLEKIKTAQQAQALHSAELTFKGLELAGKVLALEKADFEQQTALQRLREQVLRHDYEVKRLEERFAKK